jgi:uncharacterized protein
MNLRPVRLSPGADLRRAVEDMSADLPEGSGFLVSGIGSLVHARLRLANEAEEQFVAGPLEIISVSGSISADGVHLHLCVADAHGQVLGGHACQGCEVRTTAELLVADLPGYRLARELDENSGFKELVIRTSRPENPG